MEKSHNMSSATSMQPSLLRFLPSDHNMNSCQISAFNAILRFLESGKKSLGFRMPDHAE